MPKPKLLITGVSGFIGQALVDALHKDYKIYGFYEKEENLGKNGNKVPAKRRYLVDLRNDGLVEQVISHIQPEYVIHLAARSEVANSFDNYKEVGEINYGGTVKLAEANRRFNPNLRLFVFASTMETYGHQPRVPFTEETEQRPMAPYAVAKVASEKYLEYMGYAYDFPFTTLRQTNTYGRKDNAFFVVERIIAQFCTDFWKINLGEPDPERNFLYIDDLVDLYKLVLKCEPVGQTFVTGPNNAIMIEQLYYKIAALFDYDEKKASKIVEWHTIPIRPGEIYYLNSQPDHVFNMLGWEPKIDIDEGLKRTVRYWKDKTNYDEIWG